MADNSPNSIFSFDGDPNQKFVAQGGAVTVDPRTGDIYARDPDSIPGSSGWELRNIGSGSGNAEVTLNGVQTLTNKTLTAPVISTISNTGILTLPTSTDTLVGRATTDTLTNKTLTSPVISTIINTGTLTLPTSTDTLVGRATTDSLSNKTLVSPAVSGALASTIVGSGNAITLANGTYTASLGWSALSYEALTLTIDALNLNVLTLQNTNNGNAFGGISMLGADGIEHGALVLGNAGAGAFANSMGLEASYYPTSGTNAPWPMKFWQTGYINGSNQTRVMANFLATGDFQFLRYGGNPSIVFDAATGFIGLNGDNGATTNVAPVQPLDVKGTSVLGGTTGSAGRSLANGGGFAAVIITPQTTAVANTTAGNQLRIVRDNVGKTDVTFTNSGGNALNFIDTDNSSVNVLKLAMDGTGLVTHGGAIRTATPASGTSANWKLGSNVTTTGLVLSTTDYVQIDIGGTAIKLARVI